MLLLLSPSLLRFHFVYVFTFGFCFYASERSIPERSPLPAFFFLLCNLFIFSLELFFPLKHLAIRYMSVISNRFNETHTFNLSMMIFSKNQQNFHLNRYIYRRSPCFSLLFSCFVVVDQMLCPSPSSFEITSSVEVQGNIQRYYSHLTLQIYCVRFVVDVLILVAQTCTIWKNFFIKFVH